MLVVIILSVVLFISTCVITAKWRKFIQDELGYKTGALRGSLGEPLGDVKLPQTVKNYTEPRYVYENLVETIEYQPDNGHIVGYRISPSLVIHSCILHSNPYLVELHCNCVGGKLLNYSDVRTLAAMWKKISKLRVAAGYKPLKGKFVYATFCGSLVICNINDMSLRCLSNFISDTQESCLLILKRQ